MQQAAGRTGIDVPLAWGGELRCGALGCLLVSVEHEKSTVVLYEIKGRQARLLDRQAVAYHPDGAIWLTDDLLVAAVEGSFSLDVFRVVEGRLKLIRQIPIGISPRDVVLVHAAEGRFRLLATPYGGKDVIWVDYAPDLPESATRVQPATWCEAPWHPVRVKRAPGAPEGGVVTACLDEKRVVFVPEGNLMGMARTLVEIPGATRIVPRQTRPSPSGQWLYVALETGGNNLRFNMDSGELQLIPAPLLGTVSVLPLSDDLVIWAADSRLYLQRLAADGAVLETRWIPADGFATALQLIDADADGVQDLVVYNSAALPKKMGVEILYGPLWERAQPHMPK